MMPFADTWEMDPGVGSLNKTDFSHLELSWREIKYARNEDRILTESQWQ